MRLSEIKKTVFIHIKKNDFWQTKTADEKRCNKNDIF